MAVKLGRNDACFCGSGKKYKKCCMLDIATDQHSLQGIDLAWRNLRELEGAVLDKHLIPYATQNLPTKVMQQAVEYCLPDELPTPLDKELLFKNFFIPWCIFNWIPLSDFGLKNFNAKITLAQNYMQHHASALNNKEKRFIIAMQPTFYSFYSILRVEENKALHVKDMLLGTTHMLKERLGTQMLKRGDIIFGRILTLDKQSIFVGMAPFTLPTDYHHDLIDFRKWLIEENDGKALTPDALRNELDCDLLDYFFSVLDDAYNRPLPTLVNTDDELIQLSKTYFKINLPPKDTLMMILSMTLSKDSEKFLSDAQRTASGKIKQIACPWLQQGNKRHKSWENTVLGHLIIEETQLTLETNSQERAERGKTLLAELLGTAIMFQQTILEPPEQTMKPLPRTTSKHGLPEQDLMQLPEVRAQLKTMAKAHWKTWFDEPIPLLDDKTPREAAKTEDGKERLEALLLQYERNDLAKGDHPFAADISYLREELGLA
jgi:hypothetical protein